jgi:hypothetical protein
VLSLEDWAEIRRLHRAKRVPVKVIARVLGCSLAPASVGGSVQMRLAYFHGVAMRFHRTAVHT